MSKTYQFPVKPVPLDDSWDVIVVGGGPAGCSAAAAASREGAKTLLIEASACLGGMGTIALVPAWTPFSDQERLVYQGLAEKVFTAAKKDMPHVKPTDTNWVPIDAEKLKRVYDDLVTEFGVSVLFQTVLSSVEADENGVVHTLLLTNKSGLSAVRAKVFIDCTGDADLAAWAGAKFHIGDDTGNESIMPATHCFILSNVDEYGYRFGQNLHAGNPNSPMYTIVSSGKYPEIPDLHCCSNIVGPGTVGFNAGHLFAVNSTDPFNISKALIKGRRMVAAFQKALAAEMPAAFANAHLVATGSVMGIRESRRIVGDYTLTLDDYMSRRSFEDEICRNNYFIDIHAKAKEAFNSVAANKEWESKTLRYGKGESHGVPYRIMLPQGLKNVLVAGRSVSTDQYAQSSVRVMPCCLAMGEAAGLAAAIAAASAKAGKTETAGDVRAVNVSTLRTRLRERGVWLPEAKA